jgi:hypothetical protein
MAAPVPLTSAVVSPGAACWGLAWTSDGIVTAGGDEAVRHWRLGVEEREAKKDDKEKTPFEALKAVRVAARAHMLGVHSLSVVGERA